MKKVLFLVLLTHPLAHAMNIKLPDSVLFFNPEEALFNLDKLLVSKQITPKECSRLYTGIYIKAVLQQAEMVRKWQQTCKNNGTDIEVSYFTATFQACKDISGIMICPENRLSIRKKLDHFLTPSPKH